MILPFACLAAASLQQSPAANRERLMAALRELPPSRAPLAGPDGLAALDQTQALIETRLEALGYAVRLEPVRWAIPARSWPTPDKRQPGDQADAREVPAPRTPPRPFYNVLADIRGRDLADEILLIGAHFDSVPDCPGADDNGTGVAALLEIATLLKDSPHRRTIRLAFFTLEEVGLVGARAHARAYAQPANAAEPGHAAPANPEPERLIGMISLEMLGYYTDEPGSQRSPITAIEGVFDPPTVGNFLAAVTISRHATFCRRLCDEMTAAVPRPLFLAFDFLPVPVPDMLRSDHAPFLALGVPAVMLTDTANFRNPNYHRPTDSVETIDAERFTGAVTALAAAARAIAEPADAGPAAPAHEKTPER